MILKEVEELVKEGIGGNFVSLTIDHKGVEITFEKGGKYVMFARGSKQITHLAKDLRNVADLDRVISKFI